MNGKNFKEILPQYILPSLSPLIAIVLVIIQQIYYPRIESTTSINILLFVMNLLEFLLLFCKQPVNRIFCWAGVSVIAILAFLFNVRVGDIATPLSDFTAFMDSICGLWVVVLTAEILLRRFFCISLVGIEESPSSEEGKNKAIVAPYDGGNDTVVHATLTESPPSKADEDEGMTVSHPVKSPNKNVSDSDFPKPDRRDTAGKERANLFLLTFVIIALLLPFASWTSFENSNWMRSVKAITRLIFGDGINTSSTAVILLLYLLGLFGIAIAIFVGIIMVQYVLTRYLSDDTSQKNFFEEYSTPIIILVVAGALVLAIRSQNTVDPGNTNETSLTGMTSMLGYVTSLFTYILVILVAIIVLLVAFETIRLVLDQCIKKESLLKGSMHLIFILIIQYAMGLLMGILRIFALKDVIESLLLFFLPDLEQSVEPEVKQVLDAALRHEVHQTARDMKLTRPFKRQAHGKSKYRIIRKRRRRK